MPKINAYIFRVDVFKAEIWLLNYHFRRGLDGGKSEWGIFTTSHKVLSVDSFEKRNACTCERSCCCRPCFHSPFYSSSTKVCNAYF